MKVITVNKKCKVDQDNLVHCRDRKIAINILSEVNEDIDFNYVLAIEECQLCCEYYGAYLKKIHNGDDEVFVERIEHDVEVDDELLEEVNLDYGEYVACKVYGKDNKLLYIAIVYNEHNGYYAHEVCIDVNGDTNIVYI